MEPSPLALARLLIPRIPLILRTLILNLLKQSAVSDKQDARVETIVAIIRSSLAVRKPLGVIQAGSAKDVPIKGAVWVSKVVVPSVDAQIREVVIQAVKVMQKGNVSASSASSSSDLALSEGALYTLPDLVDVEAEWTGHRPDVPAKAPRPDLPSERAHYENLMKEVSSQTTVLYFHGGAYVLLDPATYRPVLANLSKNITNGGRCFSVRYRLAPQNPFPAQLLDALAAYLYLLSPPLSSSSSSSSVAAAASSDADTGVYHHPVSPKNIVFSGDSAGGNLCLALLQLLLHLRRTGTTSLRFQGRDVPVSLPAGVALNSAWCDVTRSCPSIHDNAKYDYLDPPTSTGLIGEKPFPPDTIWPATPPRAELFCQAAVMDHPLVSPIAVTSDMWRGSPPVFFTTGNEGLEDEITVVARRMYNAGVDVRFRAYEGQPHVFQFVFPTGVATKDCLARWTGFCSEVTGNSTGVGVGVGMSKRVRDGDGDGDGEGEGEEVDTRDPSGHWMIAFSNPPRFRPVELSTMGISDDDVVKGMARMKAYGVTREEQALREYEMRNTLLKSKI